MDCLEGQAFFNTIAGLAVSFAGFGAVIAWLRDDQSGWDSVNLWRVKAIIRHALIIAFLCLTLVPIHTFTDDSASTIRVGSALATAFAVLDVSRLRNPDPVVWPGRSWHIYVAVTGVAGLLALGNVMWASLGLLQGLILFYLSSPASIFSNFVRELGAGSATPDPGAD